MLSIMKKDPPPEAPLLPRVDHDSRVKGARLTLRDIETAIAEAEREDAELKGQQERHGANTGPHVLRRARALLDHESVPERHAERRHDIARRLAILRPALAEQRRVIVDTIAVVSGESATAIRDMVRPLAKAQRDALAAYVATNARLRDARDHILELGHQFAFNLPIYATGYRTDEDCATELKALLEACAKDVEAI